MNQLPKSLTQFFWYFVKKQPFSFLVFFLAPITVVLETNIIPYALKMFIDAILNYQGDRKYVMSEITGALWVGGIAWCGIIIITRLQYWLQAYVIPRFEADMRMSVMNYVMLHSYNYFSDHLSGNIAHKIRDIPKAIESIRMILCRHVVSACAVVLVTLIMMFSINQVFAWILGIWVIVHLGIILYFVKFINRVAKVHAEDHSILVGSIVDTISNMVAVKLFSRYVYELDYLGKKQKQEQTSRVSLLNTMNLFQLCMDIAVTIMLGGIVYFLLVSWQQERVSVGDFVLIFNIVFAVIYQMWNLGYAMADLFREIGIAQQGLALITIPNQIVDVAGARPLQVNSGEIKFHNVNFHYVGNTDIFINKSIVIEAGQKVGLVGFSGSGKSTFVSLILRFFDIDSGVITIDGQDITKVTQDSLRENIAVIPQDTVLFHRTLMENIRYGRPEATDLQVIEASKQAYCHDFINELPNGYNSLVGERGIKLSGGQRQRVAIARAMLKDAPILILDEATSALDSITEKDIQKGLDNLMRNRTTIVVAHRLSTLSKMDRVLVFSKGCIIEDGSHSELLKAKGHYAMMWKMQVDGFLPD